MKQVIFLHYRINALGSNEDNFKSRLEKYRTSFINSNLKNFKYIYWSDFKRFNQPFCFYNKRENFVADSIRFSIYVSKNRLEFKKSVIVIGDNYQSWIFAEIARIVCCKKIPMQASFHGKMDFSDETSKYKRYIKLILSRLLILRAQSIRFVNPHQQVEVRNFWQKNKKTIIAPIPIELPRKIISDTQKSLGFIGRFHIERGIEEWCEIVKKCASMGLINKVVLAGAGESQSWLKQKMESIPNLEIEFMGYVPTPELHEFFQKVNLVLSPAKNESYGMAIRESAASGLRVVARRNDITLKLENESNGILKVYEEVDDAIRLIKQILEAPAIDESKVCNFRSLLKVESQINLQKIINSWNELFEK